MSNATNPAAAPFVEGLNRNELRYQICIRCGSAQRLARHACTQCGSTGLEWTRSSGRGTVFAVTVVERAPSTEYRELVPYTLALIDLEEGARLMGHAEPGIGIGDTVKASFFEHANRVLVKFVRDERPGRQQE